MFKTKTSDNGHAARAAGPGQRPLSGPSAGGGLENVTKPLEGFANSVGSVIAKHPGMSLAVALTCGVAVGWLIKRTG